MLKYCLYYFNLIDIMINIMFNIMFVIEYYDVSLIAISLRTVQIS